jgi:hypothetical protein
MPNGPSGRRGAFLGKTIRPRLKYLDRQAGVPK